jgi:hypothetical protein
MSTSLEPSFVELLDTVGVCQDFKQFLANNTISSRTRFLAAAPNPAGISDSDKKNLKERFVNRHGFMVTTKRLLASELTSLIFHQYHSSPRMLKFYLPGQLRLSTSAAVVVGTTLNFNAEGTQCKQANILAPEDFGDCVVFYKTLRALFNTISYVSIADPSWFPWHVGEDLADLLLEWMNAKYGGNATTAGRRHPLSFFLQAYTTMWSHFMERVNNANNGAGMPLAYLVADVAWYRPLWTQYIPSGGKGSGGGAATGSVSHPDNPAHIARQLQTVVDRSHRLQQTVDQLRSDARRPPAMQPPQGFPGTQAMPHHGRGNVDGGYSNNGGKNGGGGNGARNERDSIKRRNNDDRGGGGNGRGPPRRGDGRGTRRRGDRD